VRFRVLTERGYLNQNILNPTEDKSHHVGGTLPDTALHTPPTME